MAVTIVDQPAQLVLPVYNKIHYRVSTNLTPATTQIYWFARIYDDINATITTPKFYYWPNASNNNYVDIDVSTVLADYITINRTGIFDELSPAFIQNWTDWKGFTLHFGERIAGVDSVVSVATGGNYIIPAAVDYYDFNPTVFDEEHFKFPDYSSSKFHVNKWLANIPYSNVDFGFLTNFSLIDWSGSNCIYTFQDSESLSQHIPVVLPTKLLGSIYADKIYVVTLTKDGTYKYAWEAIDNTGSLWEKSFKQFYIDYWSIRNNVANWDFIYTPPSSIYTNLDWREDIAYAVFTTTNLGGNSFPATRPIIVKPTCSDYKHYTVAYKTREGSYHYVLFTQKSFKETKINKETFNKFIGTPYGGTYTNISTAITPLNVNAQSTLTLNTNWLQQSEINVINELTMSPEVYVLERYNIMSKGRDNLEKARWIPVTVDDTTVKEYYKPQDKLVQYTINFNYSKPNFTTKYVLQ